MSSATEINRQKLWICILLAGLTVLVFGQTLHDGFIDFDDNQYVFENPMVLGGVTWHGIVWAFTHVHSNNWHPLTWISHMADCQIFGSHPGGHHLTNVILHTATVIALFLMLCEMTGAVWRCAFVAAVFAIHPLHVESVAWIAERKDVLSGLLFVLTLWAYLEYVKNLSQDATEKAGTARRAVGGRLGEATLPQNLDSSTLDLPSRSLRSLWLNSRYGLVFLLFALGLMAKPMLVTLPVILLLLDYWPLRRIHGGAGAPPYRQLNLWRLFVEKLPLFALSAGSCLATLIAQQGAIRTTESFSMPLRLANAAVACAIYLQKMVWPTRLAVFYPFLHGLLVGRVAVAAVLLIAVSIFVWRQRSQQPWLATGWLWYLVMLLPVAGIVQVGSQSHADRYTYLPQIGVYIAITWLAAEWAAKVKIPSPALGAAMAAIVLLFAAAAWKQTTYWKNSETLARHALACTGDNSIAHMILGTALTKKGEPDEAIPHLQEALRINPGFFEACNDLGIALAQKGRTNEAIAEFQEALKANPRSVQARNNLGRIMCESGRLDEGVAQFQEVLKIDPNYVEARNNLGLVLCRQGKLDEGILQLQEVVKLNPGFFEARNNLGNAYMKKGEVKEAIACYKKALEINPNYSPARKNLEKAILQEQ